MSDSSDITYGTHSLPKEFWTSGKAGLLKDEGFQARRRAKRQRYLTNRDQRAEDNRSGRRRGK